MNYYVCYVLCTIYYILCTETYIRYTICYMIYTIYYILYDILYTTCYMLYTIYDILYAIYDILYKHILYTIYHILYTSLREDEPPAQPSPAPSLRRADAPENQAGSYTVHSVCHRERKGPPLRDPLNYNLTKAE